ncbi:DUF192 domain-containing protein [Vreelandella subglaciescola]|uniref:DUF192 domain-containing protein n=1 Tax=Vreelandella subglaciescola TaxID=29571 RepID=A0A1M7HYR4_9GAMM|nr:DUF192 domain-containing protein [Halomonas subglaciescola]SHM33676.1 hypothetical protein SAMN05878437_2439 [Halomonas subglaciescola]
MTLTRRRLLYAALTLPAAALMPTSWLWAQTPQANDRRTAVIHTAQGPHRLSVEVAKTPAQRAQGLMGRRQLGAEHGMLFVYTRLQRARSAFWMYRTLIPLDIAFIDGDGRIVSLQTMPPCASDDSAQCPTYSPGSAYHAALEVNAGYFAERGISEGDCVSAPMLSGKCPTE